MSLFILHPDATMIDMLRGGALVILAIGQAAAAYWPDIRGREHTITSRSAALDTPVVPFGPFFAIWVLIFLSCLGFALWSALPANLGDNYFRDVGWIVSALFAGNIVWEMWVPRRGLDWISVAIILVELGLALWLLFVSASAGLSGWDYWLGAAPLQLFAGWVSVATFVNLSSTMLRPYVGQSGPKLGNPRTTPVAVMVLIASSAVGIALTVLTGSAPYAFAVVWALVGIAVANRERRNLFVLSGAAAIMTVAVGVTA